MHDVTPETAQAPWLVFCSMQTDESFEGALVSGQGRPSWLSAIAGVSFSAWLGSAAFMHAAPVPRPCLAAAAGGLSVGRRGS